MEDSTNKSNKSNRISPELHDHFAEMLAGLTEACEDAVLVVDRDLRVVLYNSALERLGEAIGIRPNAVLGRKLEDIYPALTDEIAAEYRGALASGETIERRRVLRGDKELWIESRKHPIRSGDEILFVLVFLRDITRYRHIESALRQSQQRYHDLVDNVPIGIFRSTPGGELISANPAMVRIYGFESDEQMKKVGAGATYCDPARRELLMKRLAEEGAVTGFESKHLRPDGQEIWVLSNTYAITDDQGNVLFFEGIDQDITARKKAEESLRESERLTRAVVEHSPLGISVRDRFGKLLFHNDAWLKIWNIWPEDLIDYTTRERDTLQFDKRDDYLGDWKDKVKAIYEQGGYLHIPELDLRKNRKGRPLWLSQHFYAIMDDSGVVERVVILTEDITAQREADEALRRSEEMNRLLLNNVRAAIVLVTYEGVFVFLNEAAARAHSKTVEEATGQTMWDLFPQEMADLQMKNIRHVIDTRQPFTHEICTPVSGDWRWYWVSVQPFSDSDGTVNAAMVITVDIDDRKKAEQELRASRDDLERRVAERTEQLAEANEELRLEQETLHQKNIALQEVLGQIEDGKRAMAAQIQANIDRIAMPILESMERRSVHSSEHVVKLLRECLTDIAAPFISRLDTRPVNLSPRELQICNMIRSGLSSKQIASSLNTSLLTVNKQRNQIRRKLGIANQKVNLVTYLQKLEENSSR